MSAEHLNTTQPQASAPEHAAQAPNKGRRKAVLIAALVVVALVGAPTGGVRYGGVTAREVDMSEADKSQNRTNPSWVTCLRGGIRASAHGV